jgi:molybdopterin-biosynthesis enzyme MoeA-like protein
MSRHRPSGFGLIIIGSEILDDRRQDSHFAFCRDRLIEHRLPLIYTKLLRDDPSLITDQLRWALAQQTPFFCCGGIGGTPDDYTRDCAAAALDEPVATHKEGLAILHDRFGAEDIPEPVLRMVQFPASATLIPNPVNRIPGFTVGHGHFVPGFPEMAHPMMRWVLDTYYEPGAITARHTLVLPGAREADLTTMLDALTAEHPKLSISSLPRYTESGTEVELSISGAPDAADAAFAQLREILATNGTHYTITETPTQA